MRYSRLRSPHPKQSLGMPTNPSISKEVDYPTADGRPFAETDFHRNVMFWLINTLEWRFRNVPDVKVGGGQLLYYVEGDKRRRVAPDIYLTKGIDKGPRHHYLLWKEGLPPNLIIELTSASTQAEDEVLKFNLYRDVLRVQEVFLFDPLKEYLKPQLKGYRWIAGVYARIEPVAGRLPSQEAGVHFEADGVRLRMFDPETNAYVLDKCEYYKQQRLEHAARADELKRQADEATWEADEATRQADEATRQADEATRKADEATRQADEAARQTDALRRRADELERQADELSALLDNIHGKQRSTEQ